MTHGTYGEALIQNVCHVLNKRHRASPSSALPRRTTRSTCCRWRSCCSTRSTAAKGAGDDRHLRCVAVQPGDEAARSRADRRRGGVNLPMLLRAITYREKGMETMLSKAISGGVATAS